MLNEALAYASQGFHIFPIFPGQKSPPLTRNGFKQATTDLEQIRAWWTANPEANIGWHLDASGLCAIDLDLGHPMDLDLPATMTIKTPSGGRHMIYEGQIPSTQSPKLAPHVDTRGVGGYTLLPPSIVDGVHYTFEGDEWPQPVPQWICEKLSPINKPDPRERACEDIDTIERVAKVRELAANWQPAIEGQGSNAATIELVNRLLDLCTHGVVFDAMWIEWAPRCIGNWTREWLEEKVYSVKQGSGRDSEIGCEAYPIEYDYNPANANHSQRARFEPMLPRDMLKIPEPSFWDPKTSMIPKGGIILIYGQSGHHKTNLTLTLLFDMMENGARIVYAAGEGSQGVGKARVPAHAAARGIAVEDIEALSIVQAVPLLQSSGEVLEFLEAVKGFKPNIVVIDTLATATAGLDENSSEFSSLLTDNGTVGRIRSALECTVVIIAHEGKTAGRGIRGHSGLMGNADAAISVSFEAPFIEAHVKKMRDGKDDFSVFAKVNAGGVPIPVWCSKKEAQPKATSTNLWSAWHEALRLLGAISIDTGATMPQITEKMLVLHPHLAKTPESLRVQLSEGPHLEAYQVGRKASRGSPWVYALV